MSNLPQGESRVLPEYNSAGATNLTNHKKQLWQYQKKTPQAVERTETNEHHPTLDLLDLQIDLHNFNIYSSSATNYVNATLILNSHVWDAELGHAHATWAVVVICAEVDL